MKNLSATYKGAITAVIMIIVSFAIYAAKGSFENKWQYITYAVYIAGILWALFPVKKLQPGAKFKDFFQQGFKCFIVVTLLMVLFTFVFVKMHPELVIQMEALMRADYAKDKNLMPVDIENRIGNAKKMYLPAMLMGVVFGYLLIGALITAVGSGFLSQKRN